MSVKHRIVRTLVLLYPAPWRREYGAELQDLLLARPLGLAAFGDVAWSALRQRCRATEPATLLGVTMMAIVAAGLVSNLAAPPRGGTEFTAVLRPSNMTWPSVIVFPLKAAAGVAGTGVTFDLYVLLLMAPVFALPLAAIWGAVGGQLGRRIKHFRHRLVRS